VQEKSNVTCSGSSVSSLACTVNNAGQGLAASGTGHAIFVVVTWFDVAGTTPFISSLVGNNGSDTTLTHCPTSPATGQIWTPVTNNSYGTDCYYILNSAGGTNSFTATVNFQASATSAAVNVYVVEISKSSGSITIDTEAAGNNSGSTCTSCVAPSLTLGGSNDYVLQFMLSMIQQGHLSAIPASAARIQAHSTIATRVMWKAHWPELLTKPRISNRPGHYTRFRT